MKCLGLKMWRTDTDLGVRPVLVFEGRRKLALVGLLGQTNRKLAVMRVPCEEDLRETGGSTRIAARSFRAAGKRLGSTKEARRLLRGL